MQTPARTALILTLLTTPALPSANEPSSLVELARKADFVGLAQVRDTDYLRRREIPVSGSAYLRVLIPYKSPAGTTASPRPGDAPPEDAEALVEVYEKGLHESECYFPDPGVIEEGRRYLLFLRRDPDDAARYRGLPEGCAIDVLVDRENGYVVRVPVTGIRLTAAQSALLGQRTRTMQYSDPYAVVDDEDLPPVLRDTMLAAGQIAPWTADDRAPDSADPLPPPPSPPRQWIYTLGVPLSEFRELLQLEPDR
jgi:hypothetical protein